MEKMSSTSMILIGSIVIGVAAILGFALLVKDNSEPWQVAYAEKLGLDIEKFKADLESDEVKQAVEADLAEGTERGVDSTPTIFVNNKPVVFVSNFQTDLEQAIDAELASNPGKRIKVEEFADFQCPACGSFYLVGKSIKAKYGNQIRFVYKHFPLDSIHPFARPAAYGAEAARMQGKFLEYHDLLFENQDSLTNPTFDSE